MLPRKALWLNQICLTVSCVPNLTTKEIIIVEKFRSFSVSKIDNVFVCKLKLCSLRYELTSIILNVEAPSAAHYYGATCVRSVNTRTHRNALYWFYTPVVNVQRCTMYAWAYAPVFVWCTHGVHTFVWWCGVHTAACISRSASCARQSPTSTRRVNSYFMMRS